MVHQLEGSLYFGGGCGIPGLFMTGLGMHLCGTMRNNALQHLQYVFPTKSYFAFTLWGTSAVCAPLLLCTIRGKADQNHFACCHRKPEISHSVKNPSPKLNQCYYFTCIFKLFYIVFADILECYWVLYVDFGANNLAELSFLLFIQIFSWIFRATIVISVYESFFPFFLGLHLLFLFYFFLFLNCRPTSMMLNSSCDSSEYLCYVLKKMLLKFHY